MRKKINLLLILMTAVMLCALIVQLPTANAAGISISAGSTTLEPGQSTTLTITVTGSALAGAQGTISGDMSGSFACNGGSEGSSSVSTTKTFSASTPGTYTIYAKCTKTAVYQDGNVVPGESGMSDSVTITVRAPEPTPPPSQAPTPTPSSAPTPTPSSAPKPSAAPTPKTSPTPKPSKTPQPSPTPTPSMPAVPGFRIEGPNHEEWYIQTEMPGGVSAPEGMVPVNTVVNGQNAAAYWTEDGAMTLVCTLDYQGNNAALRPYDPAKDLFLSPVILSAGGNAYPVYPISKNATLPEGYELAELETENGRVDALRDTLRENFWLILVGKEGNTFSYYTYDQQENTAQRFIPRDASDYIAPAATPTPAPSPTADVTEKEMSKESGRNPWKGIGIGAIIAAVVLAGALAVALFVQGRLLPVRDEETETVENMEPENVRAPRPIGGTHAVVRPAKTEPAQDAEAPAEPEGQEEYSYGQQEVDFGMEEIDKSNARFFDNLNSFFENRKNEDD